MTQAILSSTFFLTLLMAVGLFFFIRASFKDRTRTMSFESQDSEPVLLGQLQQYFQTRSYQVTAIEPDTSEIKLLGFVQPSLFLAIFLSTLAGIGLFCLDLLIAFTTPDYWQWSLGLIGLAPVAGIVYWKRAGRYESVAFRIRPMEDGSHLTVTAHRDELIQLTRAIDLIPSEVASSH